MRFSKDDLLGAFQRDEFVPFYQPLVELRSSQVEAFEVLARWLHPVIGTIPPDEFIPALEQNGLINDLTVCLLRQTFVAAREVPERITFSVNVSPAQLHDARLPSIIAQMASEAEFNLRRLTVELTESALLEDLSLAGGVAAELKMHGIKLALDDFGTGYSSLLHLQALPFDEIKVDSSFVRTMVQSRQSRKITSAVVSLGHSLGLRTVAEGVEEASQAELLIWHGCNLAQGWLYERAVPAERLKEVLARQLHVSSRPHASTADGSGADHGLGNRPMDRGSQLRAIYDGAPVGLCFVDIELRYVSLNRRLAEMHGIPLEAHLGRKLSEVPGFPFDEVEPYLQRSLAGEAVAAVEIHSAASDPGDDRRDGTTLVSFEPARDEAGEVIGVSISVADVSAAKESEHALHITAEALRDSESQLRAIIEATPSGVVVAEAPSGTVMFANPRAEEIMGCKLQKGTSWADVVRMTFDAEGFSLVPENMPLLRAIRQGETSKNVEIYHRRPDGSAKWLSLSASPYYSEDGALKGGVVIVDELDQPRISGFHRLATTQLEAPAS